MCKKIVKTMCFMGCLLLTVLLFCGCADKSDLVIETAYDETESLIAEAASAQTQEVSGASENSVSSEEGDDLQSEAVTIYVQVIGAVKNPGVYELTEGARVFEALQKAGGMTEDAAADSLNQAVEVTDGQMIVLYTKDEWDAMCEAGDTCVGLYGTDPGTDYQEPDDGRVNINTADIGQLCTIPGIGETRAQSIITYREENGAFGSIEAIKNVSGIKDGLFQKIKDSIKVE